MMRTRLAECMVPQSASDWCRVYVCMNRRWEIPRYYSKLFLLFSNELRVKCARTLVEICEDKVQQWKQQTHSLARLPSLPYVFGPLQTITRSQSSCYVL